MNKNEILEKYGVVLENFYPVPGAAIKITIDPDIADIETTSFLVEKIRTIYPDKAIITTLKEMEIN